MYLELALGRVSDAAGLRAHWQRWSRGTGPGARVWTGSTGGIAADGRFVAVARFASVEPGPAAEAEAAETRGDAVPAPAALHSWWSGAGTFLDGPLSVLATDDVVIAHESDPDSAGMLQVLRAGVGDRGRFEALEAEIGPTFLELRPDILAAYRAWFPDGTLAAVDYFRSEAEARAGEARDMPEHLKARFGEWLSLLREPEWYDVTDPWTASS